MSAPRAGRWGGVALLGLLALAGTGCAVTDKDEQTKEQESVPRPEWRLGDRWVFQRTLVSGASIVVTHQVVAAREGYTLRVLGAAGDVTRQWTPELHLIAETLGGDASVHFDPAVMYFAWPMGPGKTWTQEFQYTDGRNDGRYANTWKISPTVVPVDTVAGRFYALRIERASGPQRLETYWYSPRVRYWVRLEDYLRGYVEELVEYRPWGSSG
jgi:hypothetical protein